MVETVTVGAVVVMLSFFNQTPLNHFGPSWHGDLKCRHLFSGPTWHGDLKCRHLFSGPTWNVLKCKCRHISLTGPHGGEAFPRRDKEGEADATEKSRTEGEMMALIDWFVIKSINTAYCLIKEYIASPNLFCLLCWQLYRQAGSAAYCRRLSKERGERLGEATQFKTTGGCCPCSQRIYILWLNPSTDLAPQAESQTSHCLRKPQHKFQLYDQLYPPNKQIFSSRNLDARG